MSQAFTAAQLDALFNAIPTLEYGAIGVDHQWRHIITALQTTGASPELNLILNKFAVELAVWALQDSPLDSRLLNLSCDLNVHSDCTNGLPVNAWHSLATVPDMTSPEFVEWKQVTDAGGIRSALPKPADDSPHRLYWLHAGWEKALASGNLDLAKDIINSLPKDLPERAALHARLTAEWSIHALPPDKALEAVHSVKHHGFTLWRTRQTAELLRQLGDRKTATSLYQDLWNVIGFHPNLSLHLYELLAPKKSVRNPEHADAPAIVIYSWNKAEQLRQTLKSLRESETGSAPVFVLDNGSTDGTPAVLDEAEKLWDAALFQRITLPINIGAPAARNWLLSLPEIKAHPWVAFLDDDIILPPDWLTELWTTATANPQAGAVGCTVTDHTPPHQIQCADFNLLPQEQGQRSFADLQEHTFVYANAAGANDASLTQYIRPCMHVSGCCHLINMRAIETCGGFDLRFSPSQFDDLERDIRSCLAGFHSVYNGNVRIRHMQHSSLRQANTRAKNGHIYGNKIKLEHIYSNREISTLREKMRTIVREDLKHKTTRLHSMLGAQD